MANKLYNETDVENIAEAIREPLGSSTTYKISEMASGINSLADTLRSYIPHTQASGNPLNIDNVIPLKPKVLDVVGDTKQDSTTGKNKFLNIPMLKTKSGIEMTNDGKKIKLVGTDTSSDWYPAFVFYADGSVSTPNYWPTKVSIDVNKGYFTNNDIAHILSVIATGTFSGAQIALCIGRETTYQEYYISSVGTRTINFEQNSEKINFIGIGFYNHQTVNLEFEIQLEPGSTATSFEPYTGGIASPNPDYPQEIRNVKSTNGVLEYRKTGKNLLKLKTGKTIQAYGLTVSIDNDGIITLNGTASGYFPTFLISGDGDIETSAGTPSKSLNPNFYSSVDIAYGTYTLEYEYISGDGGNNYRPYVWFHNENSNFDNVQGNRSKVKTFTNSLKGVSFYVDNGSVYTNYKFRIHIVKGQYSLSDMPTYEPYKSISVPFNIGTTEFCKLPNGTADKLWVNLRTGDYGKTQNVGKVVLDGSENEWGIQNRCFVIKINDIVTQDWASRSIIVKSNYFIGEITSYRDSITDLHIAKTIDTAQPGQIGIKYLAMNNVINDFKSWLSTHNTEVQYELATPVTTTLGTLSKENLAKLAMYEGVNNLELTGYDDNGAEPIIEIDYYGGVVNG